MSQPRPTPEPTTDERDRCRAMEDLDTSFAVEAAAGAGKTSVLVARLLNLLRSGKATLREIVAITFTEKAAGELKMRIRETLEAELDRRDACRVTRDPSGEGEAPAEPSSDGDSGSAGASPSPDGSAGASPSRGRRTRHAARITAQDPTDLLRQALDDLGHATIGTIHGFCASLLRERPVEAGVDPQFTVADELEASLLRERVWRDWLEAELAAANPALLRAVAHGLSLEGEGHSLYSLAMDLLSCSDLLGGLPQPASHPDVRAFMAYARPKLGALVEELDAHCSSEGAKFRHYMEDARRTLLLAEGLGDAQAEAALLRLNLHRTFPGKKHWRPAESHAVASGIHKELKEKLDALQPALGADLAAAIGAALAGFVEAYRRRKDAEGLLDFDDLLLLTRDMLLCSREARDHFKDRFRFLLVDEFQDTDPLQVEIVFFLAERSGRHAARWDEAEPEPGKLFIVGDPKQSIYRFRRADIEIYERAKQTLGRHGGQLILSQSFRPLRSLAEVVNAIFKDVIRKPEDGAYQPDYVALDPYRKQTLPRHSVAMLYPPPGTAERMESQDDFRRAEAGCAAALIRRMVEEKWEICEPRTKEGRPRPVTYGDIAILARTFTSSELYADALADAGIPLRIVGGKHFYLTYEVAGLVAVLKAVDNPHDRLSLVAALRGPFFGVSDEELLVATCEHGPISYLHVRRTADSPSQDGSAGASPSQDGSAGASPSQDRYGGALGAAAAVLRELHERRNSESLALFLQRLYERTKALELLSLRRRGAQRVANLLKIVERARALEATQRVTFRGFVRWLSRLHETEADEAESPLMGGDEGFVQFLTIHRAKGLEFPVVFVADMTAGGRQGTNFVVLRNRVPARSDSGCHAQVPTWACGSAGTLKQELERGTLPAQGQFAFYLGRKDGGICTANWPGDDYDKSRSDAEQARLFYVAATRARDLLFLCLGWGPSPSGFMRFLPEALRTDAPAFGETTEWGHVLDTASLTHETGSAGPFLVPLPRGEDAATAGRLAAREAWQREVAGVLAGAQKGVVWRTPSTLAHEGDEGRGTGDEKEKMGETEGSFASRVPRPPSPGSEEGRGVGLLVHQALERVALAGPASLDAILDAEARTLGLSPGACAEGRRLARVAVESGLWRRAHAGAACYHEVPFSLLVGEAVLAGSMDLLFVEEGAAVVVDFKTDAVRDGAEVERRAAAYRSQVLAYALAAQRILCIPVREVILFFLAAGREWQLPITDELLREAQSIVNAE